MKFIFPKNYDFRTKVLGFIDYSTAIIDVIVLFILYFISTLLFSSLMYRITFLISLFLPILLFTFFGFQKENIYTVISYMVCFIIQSQVYLYEKDTHQLQLGKQNQLQRNPYITSVIRFLTNTFWYLFLCIWDDIITLLYKRLYIRLQGVW